MSFASFSDFLAMGDHGLYVWLSYGTTLMVVLANVISVRVSRRRFLRESAAVERRNRLGRRAHSGVESARIEEAATRAPD